MLAGGANHRRRLLWIVKSSSHLFALVLATAVKIHAPVEAAANTQTANTSIQMTDTAQPSAFIQPDPMWLVGP